MRYSIVFGFCAWLISNAVSQISPSIKATVPLYSGLGTHLRAVRTSDPLAQKYFDQGLAFLYAFNHDEANRSFQQAAEIDPDCAMAYWGIALANGGHINRPTVDADRAKKAYVAVTKAKAARANEADRELIGALSKRYADPLPEDRAQLDRAYSSAMKALWKKYPQDADIGALYAESLMNLRPWDLWTADGKPQPETREIVATLEAVQKMNPNHPLALHLYIHAVEASSDPGRANEAADRLRHLQPGLGHMVHMPSHIDVRCGRWQEAIEANRRAIDADREYRKRSLKQDFYHLYMAHNHHMLAYAAMMSGQSKLALVEVRTMVDEMPNEWARENAAIADGFMAASWKVMIRFGMWDEVLEEPIPPAIFPIARALRHHVRGVAYSAKFQTKEAREELNAMRECVKALSKESQFGNNRTSDLFEVADRMLEGEILFREGKISESIRLLREAVKHEDLLKYDEPPDWIIPVRHALGAILLHEGQASEAEKVYREDLKRWPNNGWSLFGLAESLKSQGKAEEAKNVREQFKTSWRFADVNITASCLCAVRPKR